MVRESTVVPGGHDTHRPFTNRKAVPGEGTEGTVIRHVLGAPFRLAARSAQGTGPRPLPSHLARDVEEMRAGPGSQGGDGGARAEGGMGRQAGRGGSWHPLLVGMGGRAVGGSVGRGGEGERWSRGAVEARGGEGIVKISLSDTDRVGGRNATHGPRRSRL